MTKPHWKTTFIIVIATGSIALIAQPSRSIPTRLLRSSNQVDVRSLQELSSSSSSLTCKIDKYEILVDVDGPETSFYTCTPYNDGDHDVNEYTISSQSVPTLFEEHHSNSTANEDLYISLDLSAVVLEGENLYIPDETPLNKIPSPTGQRKLAKSSFGRPTVLPVYVRTTDAAPIHSPETIYATVFVGTGSLRDQYYQCSFGQLNLQPTKEGVLQVSVNALASSGNHMNVVNLASQAAVAALQAKGYSLNNIKGFADHIMFILPKVGNFIAYSSVGGSTSVYCDKWGGFLAIQAHEVGHNFGLQHANEGAPYQDHTGYMGGAIAVVYAKTYFPRMCFNGYHFYQLGWYSDRLKTIDPTSPEVVRVAAFVDYDKTTANSDYVLVEVGNLYMVYNRAKDFNANTMENKDHVTIVQNQGTAGTQLVGRLNATTTTPLQIKDSSTGKTLTFQVCGSQVGSTYKPDVLIVSIGYGAAVCSAAQTVPSTCRAGGVPCTQNSACCSGKCAPSSANPSVSVCGYVFTSSTQANTGSNSFFGVP